MKILGPSSNVFERIFVHKNWRGDLEIWFKQALLATQPKLHSMFAPGFWRSHYQSQTHFGTAFWNRWTIICGVPSKICYAKPETIDALKDNIWKGIGEIQLHTINNMLKNWAVSVGYCMPSRGCHLNKNIFHY